MLATTAVNKNRGRASVLKSRLSAYVALCDDTGVQTIYGPYAPSRGRSRWRVQIRDSATGRKLSITASTKAEAEKLKGQLEQELAQASPLRVHEALDQYAEYKATAIRSQRAVADLIMALKLLVPDGPVMGVSKAKAEEYYLAETRRPGKSGPRAAATHQQRLRAAKAFWAWLIRREMALTNPWESVETIGKANAGKKQPREGDARLLDRHLFESAAAGDEGALALLVQLYLGLRPSEVLGLTVGGVEGAVVYVNGTKNKNAVRKLELYAPVAELLVAFCQGRPKSERIFARDRPTQPTAGWMYKRLENFCIRLQIPHICPHALRGLHSSLALAAGATSQHVAAALGHASFSTTSRHYATRESIEVGRARNFVSAMTSEPGEALREALAQHGGNTTKQSEK